MNRAERDALETFEHLKRSSWEARANRKIDAMEAYVSERKNTSHTREVVELISSALRATKAPLPAREEACHEWHQEVDANFDNFGTMTKKLITKIF